MSLSKAEKVVNLKKEQHEFVEQNERGTNARTGAREPLESWTREFEEIVSHMARLCDRMTALVARADEAGELTLERRKRLVEACHNAPRWLFVEADGQIEMPARYRMPYVDA